MAFASGFLGEKSCNNNSKTHKLKMGNDDNYTFFLNVNGLLILYICTPSKI